jgi:hypothetical protein
MVSSNKALLYAEQYGIGRALTLNLYDFGHSVTAGGISHHELHIEIPLAGIDMPRSVALGNTRVSVAGVTPENSL